MSHMNATVSAFLVATLCTLPLAGCGKKEGDKPASQVLARVNGDEISVHQVNLLLANMNGVAADPEAARKKALDKLVERQLVYQQALKEEMDRSPEVMLAIEEAKREIVASAYAKRAIRGASGPGDDEAAQYYAGHPELFAQRKVYHLRELIVPAGGAPAAEAKASFAQGQSLEAVAARLQARNARFDVDVSTRAAEQLPMDALPRLATATPGQVVVFEAAEAFLAYQVIDSRVVPVDLAAAMPRIKEFLAGRQAASTFAAEVKRLRDGAKVEYVGVPAPATAEAPVPAGQPLSDETVARGMAGMK